MGDSSFLVLGTDGLWDFFTPQEAADRLVRPRMTNCVKPLGHLAISSISRPNGAF